jgi:hypothetical protein
MNNNFTFLYKLKHKETGKFFNGGWKGIKNPTKYGKFYTEKSLKLMFKYFKNKINDDYFNIIEQKMINNKDLCDYLINNYEIVYYSLEECGILDIKRFLNIDKYKLPKKISLSKEQKEKIYQKFIDRSNEIKGGIDE